MATTAAGEVRLTAPNQSRLRIAQAQHAAARERFRNAVASGDRNEANSAVTLMTKYRAAARRIAEER